MSYLHIQRISRFVALPLAVIMLAGGFRPGVGHAIMISTDQVLSEMDVDANRARVQEFLGRAEVAEQIQALGVDPAEAAARVASLSDAELARISGRLDQLPAGQSTAGAILGAILLILIILIITDVLGLTNVFPAIQPATT